MDESQLDVVLATLMNSYDLQHPDAPPFARGLIEYELKGSLRWIDKVGYKVVKK